MRPSVVRLALLGLTVSLLAVLTPGPAQAATRLTVYVGYMDTHTAASSAKQPRPWPFKHRSRFVGSPCDDFGGSRTCWDAGAVRIDNPGSRDVRVRVVVRIGGRSYDLWGKRTVKAGGRLVLTETGSQNSQNFDGSDLPPNDYNGGKAASCTSSGAIPRVRVTVRGVTRTYRDSGQVLNTGGVDKGHCVHGAYVSARRDESHPWVRIGRIR